MGELELTPSANVGWALRGSLDVLKHIVRSPDSLEPGLRVLAVNKSRIPATFLAWGLDSLDRAILLSLTSGPAGESHLTEALVWGNSIGTRPIGPPKSAAPRDQEGGEDRGGRVLLVAASFTGEAARQAAKPGGSCTVELWRCRANAPSAGGPSLRRAKVEPPPGNAVPRHPRAAGLAARPPGTPMAREQREQGSVRLSAEEIESLLSPLSPPPSLAKDSG